MLRRNVAFLAVLAIGLFCELAPWVHAQVSGPTTITPRLHVLGPLTVDGVCTGCASVSPASLHLTGTLTVDGASTLTGAVGVGAGGLSVSGATAVNDLTVSGTCTGCGGGSGATVFTGFVCTQFTAGAFTTGCAGMKLPAGWSFIVTDDNTSFGFLRIATNISCADPDNTQEYVYAISMQVGVNTSITNFIGSNITTVRDEECIASKLNFFLGLVGSDGSGRGTSNGDRVEVFFIASPLP